MLARPVIQASLSHILVSVPRTPHFPQPSESFLSGRTKQPEPLISQQLSDRSIARSPVEAAVAHHRSPPDGRSELQALTRDARELYPMQMHSGHLLARTTRRGRQRDGIRVTQARNLQIPESKAVGSHHEICFIPTVELQ
ncbi:hypothetical protein SVAN01_10937 [Stagonosporopsis vannaccii]|nr:hypothetical protein SVAN01_10937 [Stagonosporopsis vannaccii]